MKKIFLLAFCLITFGMNAQLTQKITLPKPVTEGGVSLNEALAKRSSCRDFDATKSFSNQELSNILWAANGFNRADKRTAPSALNFQEVDIYVFTKAGVYLWNPKDNVLQSIVVGDHRADAGTQPFVKDAALNLVYVADYSKMNKLQNDSDKALMTAMDCGHISQNVYLHSAANNYGVVVRGSFDATKLQQLLKLTANQHIVLTQSVGLKK